jgi:hypothetical protein
VLCWRRRPSTLQEMHCITLHDCTIVWCFWRRRPSTSSPRGTAMISVQKIQSLFFQETFCRPDAPSQHVLQAPAGTPQRCDWQILASNPSQTPLMVIRHHKHRLPNRRSLYPLQSYYLAGAGPGPPVQDLVTGLPAQWASLPNPWSWPLFLGCVWCVRQISQSVP